MLNRSLIIETEEEALINFFGLQSARADIPPLPDWIDDGLIQYWQENIFHLHYVPETSLDKNFTSPIWRDKPCKIFYKAIREGKIQEKSLVLPGKWILIDGRDKPAKKVIWITSKDTRFLQKIGLNAKNYFKKWRRQLHKQDYLIKVLNQKGFGSRFCLSIHDINKLKPEILDFLKVDRNTKIRLPFFIEYNYLGNVFYKQWGATATWEWFEDMFGGKQNLAGGSESVGCIGWEPPDFWSTILTFRPVVEF